MNAVGPVLKMSKDEMAAFFREQFVAIDNIPEDTARRDRIVMEARPRF